MEVWEHEGGGDPLVRFLMPVVLHKLANVTQLLTGVSTLLGMGEGADLLEARSRDLQEGGELVEDLGWVMAILGSASGDDLLLARRKAQGLDVIASLVTEGARRDGLPQLTYEPPLPLLTSGVMDGWQLPWCFGSVLLAALQNPEGKPVHLVCRGSGEDGWILELPAGPGLETCLGAAKSVLPDLKWQTKATTEVSWPADWLTLAGAPGVVTG